MSSGTEASIPIFDVFRLNGVKSFIGIGTRQRNVRTEATIRRRDERTWERKVEGGSYERGSEEGGVSSRGS
jgi:hypothetical protein